MRSAIYILVTLALTAAPAGAQDKTDPIESATMHIWKIGMNPSLSLRDIGRDYNVYNEATNPKQDFTATITSKADILFHPGPLLLTYTTSSDLIWYQKYKDQRGGNSAQSVKLDFAFGPLKPTISYGTGGGKDRINREIDTRVKHQEKSYGGSLGIQLFEPLTAGVSVRRVEATFPDAEYRGERLDVPLNSTNDTIESSAAFAITQLTTISMVVGHEEMRFPLSPDRNSHSLRIAPRVNFSPLAMLQGSASLGYRRFVSDSKRLEGFTGLVGTVGLGTTIAGRHRIDGQFSRDLSYSYEKDIPYYLETGESVNWAFQVFGPVDLRLNAGRSRLNYRAPTLTSADDDDVVNTYGFGVAFRLKETLRLGLNGEWRDRRSERSVDKTYNNHRIFANMTWGKS